MSSASVDRIESIEFFSHPLPENLIADFVHELLGTKIITSEIIYRESQPQGTILNYNSNGRIPNRPEFNIIQDALRNKFFGAHDKLWKQERYSITKCIRFYHEQRAKLERMRSLSPDVSSLNQSVYNLNNESKTIEDFLGESFLVCTAFSCNYTLGQLSAPINKMYCDLHGYTWIQDEAKDYNTMMELITPRKNCSWYKILFLKKILNHLLNVEIHPEFSKYQLNENIKYIMWIDADAIIINRDVTLSSIISIAQEMNLIISEDMNTSSYLNAGIFMLKVKAWSKTFLEDVWETSKYHSVAHFDQAAIEKQLKIRFEGLDQIQPFHSYAGGPEGRSCHIFNLKSI